MRHCGFLSARSVYWHCLFWITGLLVGNGAAGEEPRLYPLKFETGKAYHIRNTQLLKLDMDHMEGAFLPGEQSKYIVDLEVDIRISCRRHPENQGYRVVRTRLDALTAEVTTGSGRVLQFTEQHGESVTGREFEFVLNARNELVQLSDVVPENGKGGFDVMWPDQISNILLPSITLGIPPEGVSRGHEWTCLSELSLGSKGHATLRRKMKHFGSRKEEGREVSVVTYQGEINLNLQDVHPLGRHLSRYRTEHSSVRGELLVDPEVGFPVSNHAFIEMTVSFPDLANPGERASMPLIQEIRSELLRVEDLGDD